ncbi:MAG: aspartate 1-decarboxylase [Actinomycetales bacterium]|nr:aspartate 1-decarboxylase [Actinomycetales bacterium]
MTSLLRPMVISKIHRATITDADLHYVGSITVDTDLLEAADLLPGQQVDVVDVTNGNRLTTYVLPGEPGSGEICINGAAAHLVHAGDIVILMAYGLMGDAEARTYTPKVVFVDENNTPIDISGEPGRVPDTEAGQAPNMMPSGLPFRWSSGQAPHHAGEVDEDAYGV